MRPGDIHIAMTSPYGTCKEPGTLACHFQINAILFPKSLIFNLAMKNKI